MAILAINKTYRDGDILFEFDLDNVCDSVEAYLNATTIDEGNIQSSVTSALTITGMIVLYGSTSPPTGWLECKGDAISKTTYAALYQIVQDTYNTGGEGAGNFRLPDFRRRAPMGAGGVSISGPANTLGATGGSETHTLIVAELGPHAHTESGNHMHTETTVVNAAGPNACAIPNDRDAAALTTSVSTQTATVPTSQSTGGDGAHNNIQPSLVSCFIIKT